MKTYACENQWNMPILTRFPFLTNILFLLGWIVVLIFFIGLFCNVPITEFSQMSIILSQCYLLTIHTNGSDNLLVPIVFLLPQPLASCPRMDWSSCLAVNLGLTSSPLLFAESHVSLFLELLVYFGRTHLQYLPMKRNMVDQFFKFLHVWFILSSYLIDCFGTEF